MTGVRLLSRGIILPRDALRRPPPTLPGWDDCGSIYWTEHATYCLVKGDTFTHPTLGKVSLLSINGCGEVRWRVDKSFFGANDDKLAYEAFGLEGSEDNG